MRKILGGAAVAAYVGLAGTAMAGGLYEDEVSLKDEPVLLPPIATWTGFYVGAGVGAGAVVHDLDVDAEDIGHLSFDGIGGEGILGTAQIGYDWQFSPRWVVGAFADADWSGLRSDVDFEFLDVSGETDLDMDFMWTVGGRVGYLLTPDTLAYVLAGYSQADFGDPSLAVSVAGDAIDVDASLDTFSGWSAGAGMEGRIDRNWSLKVEYRYTQLDSDEFFSFAIDGSDVTADLEPSIHTGRVLLSYRFNRAPAPLEPYK